MSKEIDSYDVSCELLQIKDLLFFLGEALDVIGDSAMAYEQQKPNSDKMLAHTTNRCISELITLQSILYRKVFDLEKKFE